jgi:hypothetical protein
LTSGRRVSPDLSGPGRRGGGEDTLRSRELLRSIRIRRMRGFDGGARSGWAAYPQPPFNAAAALAMTAIGQGGDALARGAASLAPRRFRGTERVQSEREEAASAAVGMGQPGDRSASAFGPPVQVGRGPFRSMGGLGGTSKPPWSRDSYLVPGPERVQQTVDLHLIYN